MTDLTIHNDGLRIDDIEIPGRILTPDIKIVQHGNETPFYAVTLTVYTDTVKLDNTARNVNIEFEQR